MGWEIIGRGPADGGEGPEWVWLLRRGDRTHELHVASPIDGRGQEYIEALLQNDELPEYLCFPPLFSPGDVVEYVGPIDLTDPDDEPNAGARGVVIDFDNHIGEAVVDWEGTGALCHGLPEEDLRRVVVGK
jgi:hypothetical protein